MQKKNEQAKSLDKLSSGEEKKIEDPAMAMLARAMMTDILGDVQGLKNANSASAMMQIADGALSQASKMSAHLQELSVASNSAALSSSEQSALKAEFSATVESINMSFSSATFNGKQLFGESMSFSFNATEISVSLSEMNTRGLSIDSQESIEDFVKQIQENASNVGSAQNSIKSVIENLTEAMTQKSAARSQMSDADMAETMTKYQNNEIQLEASLMVHAYKKDISAQRVAALLN
jgi:flagellin